MSLKKITIIIEEAKLEPIDLSPLFKMALSVLLEVVPNGKMSEPHHHSRKLVKGNSTKQEIMSHYTPEGMFTIELAGKWLEKAKYNPNSASPSISWLIRNGYLERIGGIRGGKVKFLRPMEQG